jgi:hypothetical protein
MKLYSLPAVTHLIEQYYNKGGEVTTTKEGTLLDDYVMHGENLKTAVVTARYLNSQSSAYTIRFYNKTPKKYQSLISNT